MIRVVGLPGQNSPRSFPRLFPFFLPFTPNLKYGTVFKCLTLFEVSNLKIFNKYFSFIVI